MSCWRSSPVESLAAALCTKTQNPSLQCRCVFAVCVRGQVCIEFAPSVSTSRGQMYFISGGIEAMNHGQIKKWMMDFVCYCWRPRTAHHAAYCYIWSVYFHSHHFLLSLSRSLVAFCDITNSAAINLDCENIYLMAVSKKWDFAVHIMKVSTLTLWLWGNLYLLLVASAPVTKVIVFRSTFYSQCTIKTSSSIQSVELWGFCLLT